MIQVALSTQEWTAIGSVLTALILLVTLPYVAFHAHEARKLRREEFRPWVTVRFHFRSIIVFIAIRNVGRTAARDLTVRFEPEFATTLEPDLAEVAMLKQSTPLLAPGEERLLEFDRYPDRITSDLPKQHTVIVAYSDHRGRPLPAEEFVLDFAALEGVRLPDKGLNDLVGEVEKIRKQLSDSGDHKLAGG